MKVQEVMSQWVKTVTPDTQMNEVATVMCLHRVSGLPVVDAEHKLLGFIAEKDVLHHLFPKLEDLIDSAASMSALDFEAMEGDYNTLKQLSVRDLMTTRVVTVSPEMPILRATSVMVQHRFRRIPVADNGYLKGMLSLGDVHKALFRKNLAS